MINGTESIRGALDDFGAMAMTPAGPLAVIPCLEGARDDGDMISQAGPYVLASVADVAGLPLAVGDPLTLGGVAYTLLVIDPDRAGLVLLGLEVAP